MAMSEMTLSNIGRNFYIN